MPCGRGTSIDKKGESRAAADGGLPSCTMTQIDKFHSQPWPVVRNAVLTTLSLHRRHTVYGFIEVDVTQAMALIAQYRRELRVPVTLHAFVAYCLTQAVQKHPMMHTFRHGRSLIRFDDIDVATAIDRRMPDGHRMAVGYTFRAAQAKSLARINWELRAATNTDLSQDPLVKLRRRFARLPWFVRSLFAWRMRNNPHLLKRINGTVGLTNLQSPGVPGTFWALPPNVFTCTVAIGGIAEREGRKMLCLAAGVDHAITDGLTLSRFTASFGALLQNAAGLDDTFVEETRRLRDAEREAIQ